jgi:integrase
VHTVAVPAIVLDEMRTHLDRYSEAGPEGVVFVGPKGGRLRRHNFRKIWPAALADAKIAKTDVHFHGLRHTGNDLAAKVGATTKELMTRMGHASMPTALIYQHASRDHDRAIADEISRNVEGAHGGHAE